MFISHILYGFATLIPAAAVRFTSDDFCILSGTGKENLRKMYLFLPGVATNTAIASVSSINDALLCCITLLNSPATISAFNSPATISTYISRSSSTLFCILHSHRLQLPG